MAPPTTPGVYVEEKSLLPPSVAEVATAIPAFIGYTANHGDQNGVIVGEITSLRDYESKFGKGPVTHYVVKKKDNIPQLFLGSTTATARDQAVGLSEPKFLLWYAMELYFRNGGGRCYVVSVGTAAENKTVEAENLLNGLEQLRSYDEPTLIVIPEATKLDTTDFKQVSTTAVQHCSDLKDRFAILDVPPGTDLTTSDDLTKTRAFYPSDCYGAVYYPHVNTTLVHLYEEAHVEVDDGVPDTANQSMEKIKDTETDLYNQIKKLLADQRVILPPSAAIAGAYVRVDRERGVWKAPANVALQAVISPVLQLTDDQQGGLNVEPGGKSINAIRVFSGRGTVIWGARTLAGNDNEWKYVPVRRLFITIEESVKKATSFAVFEPNDASTWLKVKGMIDSYLYGLWERGALQGSKAESAYFVNVGLGKTMTAQDILDGLMIVEIGIAAVRPAEFIILRFSHQLAQA